MHRTNSTGSTPGGWADTGNTSIGSPVITGLGSTGAVNPGDYVLVSAGFPDFGRIRVVSKTVNTITLAINSTSNQTGVTVTSQANMYTDGLAGVVARTILGAKHMNTIQEELANLVIAAGGSVAGEIQNNALTDLVVRINGGQKMTGDLEMPSIQFTKKITGTAADLTKNIQASGGGYYEIDTLAFGTNKTLFEFGSIISEKRFLIDLSMYYVYDIGIDRIANFKGVTRTGKTGDTETMVIVPQDADQSYASDTPLNLGGFYIHDLNIGAPANDAAFDAATAKNERPMIIIREDKIDIRNSHTSKNFTALKIYLRVFNLFI